MSESFRSKIFTKLILQILDVYFEHIKTNVKVQNVVRNVFFKKQSVLCSTVQCNTAVWYSFIVPTDAHNYKIMAAYQPVMQACGTRQRKEQFLPLRCTARLHNRLVCRHDIDHVINDEHNRIIIVVLAKHEIAP